MAKNGKNTQNIKGCVTNISNIVIYNERKIHLFSIIRKLWIFG